MSEDKEQADTRAEGKRARGRPRIELEDYMMQINERKGKNMHEMERRQRIGTCWEDNSTHATLERT
jgi:hypothetical protein